MLILTRKRNERIMIGDSIEVVIVDIRGEQVQLGINAPRDVPVHRREVYEAIVRENGRVLPKTPRQERMNSVNKHRNNGDTGGNEQR